MDIANKVLLVVMFVALTWLVNQAMHWHHGMALIAKMECADVKRYPERSVVVTTSGGIWRCMPPVALQP